MLIIVQITVPAVQKYVSSSAVYICIMWQVQAYCDAHVRQTSDKELQKLSEYLQDIADVDDLSKLNHCKWEQ